MVARTSGRPQPVKFPELPICTIALQKVARMTEELQIGEVSTAIPSMGCLVVNVHMSQVIFEATIHTTAILPGC
jgi:hypothetical protein